MGRVLFCRRCTAGEIIDGDVPAVCQFCGQRTTWLSLAPLAPAREVEPVAPLKFTRDDRIFLKCQRISAE